MIRGALLIAALFAQAGPGVTSDRGIVTGRILSTNGTPAQGVRVIATAAPDPTGRTNGVTIVVSIAQSGDDGRFRLENIPPGAYYISAGQLEIPTYYPGVVKDTAATVIKVAPGSTTPGIDFRLVVPSSSRVRGRVALAPGASIPNGAKIRLAGTGGSSVLTSSITVLNGVSTISTSLVLSDQLMADIASDGSFEIPRVRPGNYSISFTPSVQFFHPQTVLIAEENVNLDIGVPATIQVVAGVAALEGAEVGELPSFMLQFSGLYNVTRKVANNSGGFQVELPDGDYTVNPNGLPDGYSIKSLRAGTADLLVEPYRLKAGEPPERINATVAVDLSTVSGRVVGIDPTIGGVTGVALTGGPARTAKEAPLKEDGSFQFPQLPPGFYELNILGPAEASYYLKPVVVKLTNRNLTSVEIRIGRRRALTGKVSIEPSGAPIPTFALSLENDLGLTTVPVKPERDGSFTVLVPDGDWRTEIHGLPFGYSSKAFTNAGTDLVNERLRVSGVTLADLRVVFGVSPEALAKVRGRVTGIDSTENARVLLSGSVIASDMEASVLSDGSFEFSGVPQGLYTVRPSDGTSATTPFFTAGGVDVAGVELNVPRAILGRIVVEGANGQQTVVATIAVHAADKQLTFSGPVAQGPFLLPLIEGEQTVSIQELTGGYQVQSMSYGSRNLLVSPLVVSGPPTAEIVVTIAARPTTR